MPHTENSSDSHKDWREVLAPLFRHKTKAIVFFCSVVLVTLVVLAFTPPEYTSTAKLIVRRSRENVFLNPVTTIGETRGVQKTWASEIKSELEILGNRELSYAIVQEFGADAFLKAPELSRSGKLGPIRSLFSPLLASLKNFKQSIGSQPDSDAADKDKEIQNKAIEAFEENLLIEDRVDSDIIIVSYTASDAELPQKVTNRLIDLYLDKRIGILQVPGTQQIFAEQAKQVLAELKQTDADIRSIKNEAGVSALTEDQQALQLMVEEVRTRKLEIQSALAASNARIATLRNMVKQSSSLDKSTTQKNGRQDATGNVPLGPEEYRALLATLRTEESTQSGLLAEEQEIKLQLDQLKSELVKLSEIELPVRRLQRKQVQLEERYRKFSENQELARINQTMETKRISNVSIVQHATSPGKPNPSGKLMKLLAAMFLGMTGAIAIAYISDALDPTLHSARDVTSRLGQTTLIELPNLKKKEISDRKSIFRRLQEKYGINLSIRLLARKLTDKLGVKRVPRWIPPPPSTADDYFRDLCFKILSMAPNGVTAPMTIGITSGMPKEGVSMLSLMLCKAFFKDGRYPKIMLLDANPVRHSNLANELLEDAPFSYCQYVGVVEHHGENEEPSINAKPFFDFLSEVKTQGYDIIIVDIPAMSTGSYPVLVATAMDLVVFMVECGRLPWRNVQRSVELLGNAKAKLCGIVLNRTQQALPKWLYQKL